jgi:hypothetical protein
MAFGPVSPLRAQAGPKRVVPVHPLVALAINDLSFGTVLPGIPSSVSVGDAHHAGRFEIDGPASASIRVEFVLPPALVAGGGELLPVTFGAGDALVVFSAAHSPHAFAFDPHSPVIVALGSDGRLFVVLGGTVFPARTEAGGAYSATITMTVFNLGS